MGVYVNLVGRQFGRLFVLQENGRKNKKIMYSCKCSCGIIKDYSAGALNNGVIISCGCSKREKARERITRINKEICYNKTHALSKSSTYTTWLAMKARCTNVKAGNYKYYGARGITVCNNWLTSFETFVKDMGMRPFATAQIDRIDNNGNYEPANCRWVTAKINSNNKRNSKIGVFNA